jgi:transcriptional regulator with XRE-family HTH domain
MGKRERFLKELGARMADARKREGLTQGKMGKMVGVSQQIIADYESGSRQIGVWRLVCVAQALGVEVADLLGGGEQRPRKRGPTPKIQKQLEAVAALPKAKQGFVSEVLTNILKEAP